MRLIEKRLNPQGFESLFEDGVREVGIFISIAARFHPELGHLFLKKP